MVSARLLALATAAAVAMPAIAVAETSKSSSSSKTSTSTSKSKSKSKTASKSKSKSKAKGRSASKRKRRHRDDDRRPNRRTVANMPTGWSWPPTKAMLAEGEACTRKLDELGIAWEKADREGRMVTPVVVPAMELGGLKLVSVYRRGPHAMDCHLALGLATYGPQLVAIGIRELHFSSIFRNTKVRVNGTTKNMLSRHALGLAVDVRSFVDEAGREAVVETDYNAADPMLLQVEEVVNNTGGFRTVLTPRNDPASHYDHFHLEISVEYPVGDDEDQPSS
jgi:hypothetical protein